MDNIKQLLLILLQSDRRMLVCTYHKVGNTWEHTNRCPRCAALAIVNA